MQPTWVLWVSRAAVILLLGLVLGCAPEYLKPRPLAATSAAR